MVALVFFDVVSVVVGVVFVAVLVVLSFSFVVVLVVLSSYLNELSLNSLNALGASFVFKY